MSLCRILLNVSLNCTGVIIEIYTRFLSLLEFCEENTFSYPISLYDIFIKEDFSLRCIVSKRVTAERKETLCSLLMKLLICPFGAAPFLKHDDISESLSNYHSQELISFVTTLQQKEPLPSPPPLSFTPPKCTEQFTLSFLPPSLLFEFHRLSEISRSLTVNLTGIRTFIQTTAPSTWISIERLQQLSVMQIQSICQGSTLLHDFGSILDFALREFVGDEIKTVVHPLLDILCSLSRTILTVPQFSVPHVLPFLNSVLTMVSSYEMDMLHIPSLEIIASIPDHNTIVKLVYYASPTFLPQLCRLITTSEHSSVVLAAITIVSSVVVEFAKDSNCEGGTGALLSTSFSTEQLLGLLEGQRKWIDSDVHQPAIILEAAVLLAVCYRHHAIPLSETNINAILHVLLPALHRADQKRVGFAVTAMDVNPFRRACSAIAQFRNVTLPEGCLASQPGIFLASQLEPLSITFSLLDALRCVENSLYTTPDRIFVFVSEPVVINLIVDVLREALTQTTPTEECSCALRIMCLILNDEPTSELFIIDTGILQLLCDIAIAHPSWESERMADVFAGMYLFFRWDFASLLGRQSESVILKLVRSFLHALTFTALVHKDTHHWIHSNLETTKILLRAIRRSMFGKGLKWSREIVKEPASPHNATFYEMTTDPKDGFGVRSADELIDLLDLRAVRARLISIAYTSQICNLRTYALLCLESADGILNQSSSELTAVPPPTRATRSVLYATSHHFVSSSIMVYHMRGFNADTLYHLDVFRDLLIRLKKLFGSIDSATPEEVQTLLEQITSVVIVLVRTGKHSNNLDFFCDDLEWLLADLATILPVIKLPELSFRLAFVLIDVIRNLSNSNGNSSVLAFRRRIADLVLTCLSHLLPNEKERASEAYITPRIVQGLIAIWYDFPTDLVASLVRRDLFPSVFQGVLKIDSINVVNMLFHVCHASTEFTRQCRQSALSIWSREDEPVIAHRLQQIVLLNCALDNSHRPALAVVILLHFKFFDNALQWQINHQIETTALKWSCSFLLPRILSKFLMFETSLILVPQILGIPTSNPRDLIGPSMCLANHNPLSDIPREYRTQLAKHFIEALTPLADDSFSKLALALNMLLSSQDMNDHLLPASSYQMLLKKLKDAGPNMRGYIITTVIDATTELTHYHLEQEAIEGLVDVLDLSDEDSSLAILLVIDDFVLHWQNENRQENREGFDPHFADLGFDDDSEDDFDEDDFDEDDDDEEEGDEESGDGDDDDEDSDDEDDSDITHEEEDDMSILSLLDDNAVDNDDGDPDDLSPYALQPSFVVSGAVHLTQATSSLSIADVISHLPPFIQNEGVLKKLISVFEHAPSIFLKITTCSTTLAIFANVPFPQECSSLFVFALSILNSCRLSHISSDESMLIATIVKHPLNAQRVVESGLLESLVFRLLHSDTRSFISECLSLLSKLCFSGALCITQKLQTLLRPHIPRLTRLATGHASEAALRSLVNGIA
ncbi:hypothetical protein BLNAU_693 [Blattamonas nauphoetae]|uniref:Uncharacterized protein n=1 Tax=Blattamonas nauphoetae TaxID=2049346 RepID=A0ABQ9YK87_9EUKA|nr:hypothetical protein BLNAU_693 [Blattamonas nauphoetae]